VCFKQSAEDEARKDCKKNARKELHILLASPNIVRVIK